MARLYAYAAGAVLVLVGILGFFADRKLLGVFEVDTLHNLIHIASGAAALFAASRGEAYAKLYARIFGVIYALVLVAGLIRLDYGVLSLNQADNVLHFVIAAATLYVGFGKLPQIGGMSRAPAST